MANPFSEADRPVSARQEEFLRAHHRHHHTITFCRFFLFLLFLGIWELAARLAWIDSFFFSSPSGILQYLHQMFADHSIYSHTGITLLETIVSFLLVTLLSLSAATLLWYFSSLSEILEPYLVVLNSLPKSALAPLLIVWLGNNMKTVIVAAVSVAVFGSILTLHTGFVQTNPDKIKLIYSLGGSKKDVLTKVLIPGSIPLIISNMKVNVGLCLVGVIIGEFLSAKAGLGYLIIYASQVFKMDMLVMAIVILCIVSTLLYQGIAVLEKKITG